MIRVVKSAAEFVKQASNWDPESGNQGWKRALDDLLSEIGECESRGIPRSTLLASLEEVRAIHATSPFIRRLQTWPRGYPGDYETIEYICQRRNGADPLALGYELEQLALDSPIAQQHRNKVATQATLILEQVGRTPRSRILLAGCGGARDLRLASRSGDLAGAHVVLNDIDPEALAFARLAVGEPAGTTLECIEGNILRLAIGNKLGGKPFDLVLFGGVFDYLPSKAIHLLLTRTYANHLREGGRLVFTNIGRGNPYRIWIEYCADWTLVERSESDCVDLCRQAGIPAHRIRVSRDRTGLTWIVECTGS